MDEKLIRLSDLQKFPIRINHYDKVNGNEHFVLGIESVLEYAEHLPTVDAVEVVHGRWIERYEKVSWQEDDVERFFECSICGCISGYYSPYCPNCGADMRERRTDE